MKFNVTLNGDGTVTVRTVPNKHGTVALQSVRFDPRGLDAPLKIETLRRSARQPYLVGMANQDRASEQENK